MLEDFSKKEKNVVNKYLSACVWDTAPIIYSLCFIVITFLLKLYLCTTDRIFKKRGYERDEFLFRTVIKIRKIQFTQFLHTSASKFFIRALPRYYMLQPILDILFYIALLSNKILVLFGLDFRAGNSKFQRPNIPAHSAESY